MRSTIKTSGGNSGNDWTLVGNGGAVSDANFIGTTTNIPFNIRVNNEKSGRIDPSLSNTFFGYKTGNATPTGQKNTAFGDMSLSVTTTGQSNTALGNQALFSNTTGQANTATGNNSLYSNTTGNYNTANGADVLYSNTSGSYNTATGINSLYFNTSGTNNTAYGYAALTQNNVGAYNTAIGQEALSQNTSGTNNTAIGQGALGSNLTGGYNIAVGESALLNSIGSSNVAVGFNALISNISGTNNTALGTNANVSSNNLTNATAIGSNSKVSVSNSMILGDNNVNVGIGLSGITPGPSNKLEINSASTNASGLRFRQLTATSAPMATNPGNGVLALDTNGDVVYVAVSGGAGGPTPWGIGGNNGINALTHYLGTINNADLVIKTNSVEKMRVLVNGNVGIGTNNPVFKLSLDNDGGIIGIGEFANGATLSLAGGGTRMVWYPRKSAFRAGTVAGSQWDDAYIGNYSFASGSDVTASGMYASALGGLNTASGDASAAFGYQTTASGIAATSLGYQTIAAGAYSVAAGYQANAVGYFSFAIGKNATASVAHAMALGFSVNADAAFATAMGNITTASGNSSTAMGSNTTASGDFTTAMGSNASTNSKIGSFVIGDHAGTTTLNSGATNEFSTRFSGGYRLYSNSTLTAGVILAPGAGAWANVSDKTKKENFQTLQASHWSCLLAFQLTWIYGAPKRLRFLKQNIKSLFLIIGVWA